MQVFSGGYPLGAMLSSSGSWWDARGGVTDGTPARYRKIFASDNPSPAAQFIAGGGITPGPACGSAPAWRTAPYRDEDGHGLLRPARYAASRRRRHRLQPRGRVRVPLHAAQRRMGARSLRKHDLAGDYARLLHSRRADDDAADFRGVALHPHVNTGPGRDRARAVDARVQFEFSGGYRLTPDWILKGGYEASRRYGATDWAHAAALGRLGEALVLTRLRVAS